MALRTSYKINDKQVDDIIKRARGVVNDLRPAFKVIASDFQRGNRAIFKLQGPGQYEDFKGPKVSETWRNPGRPDLRTRNGDLTAHQNYKVAKGYGPKGYPLLKLSGRLEKSLTRPGGEAVIIMDTQSLELGTDVDYAQYHQDGTGKMARRPVVFLRPGDGAPDGIAKRRLNRWLNILNDFILKEMGAKTRLPVKNDGKGVKL